MLRDATLDEYLRWFGWALRTGREPQYFYDCPFGKMAFAESDFTMGGECGARAIEILADSGVTAYGNKGHNEIRYLNLAKLHHGSMTVYNDPQFFEFPGIPEYIRMERAREEARWRESEYRSRMYVDSDVRTWSER